MNKNTYDTLIACGFEILNYPPKLNQAEPTFIKVKHPTYNTITMIKHDDSLEVIMKEILYKLVDVGYVKGKQEGKIEYQGQIKTMLGL